MRLSPGRCCTSCGQRPRLCSLGCRVRRATRVLRRKGHISGCSVGTADDGDPEALAPTSMPQSWNRSVRVTANAKPTPFRAAGNAKSPARAVRTVSNVMAVRGIRRVNTGIGGDTGRRLRCRRTACARASGGTLAAARADPCPFFLRATRMSYPVPADRVCVCKTCKTSYKLARSIVH